MPDASGPVPAAGSGAGAPDGSALLAALADEGRLRAFAAVLLGAASSADVAARAGLRDKDAVRLLARLESTGLVGRTASGWTAYPGLLRDAAAAAAPQPPPVDPTITDPVAAAVLRTFLPGGRLAGLPAQESKRRIVLEHVAAVFEPGVRYPEREVNAMLRAFWHDHAALRRYLVDYGYLAREAGEYWRIGGTFTP